MTKLMQQGFDPASTKIQSLKTQYEALGKESKALSDAQKNAGGAFGQLKNGLIELDNAVGGVGNRMLSLAKNPIVLLITAVVETTKFLVDSTRELINYGDEMHDLALQTGLSTKALQEYKFVAEQSGGSLGTITSAIKLMTRGLETNKDTYKELGIQIRDSTGNFLPAEQIFDNTIDVLGKLDNETEKSNIALKLFGRGALEMVPLLKLGKTGLQDLKDEANKLGLVLSDNTIKNADSLADATKALSETWKAFTMSMVQGSLPMLLSLTSILKNVAINAVETRNKMDIMSKGLTGTAAESVQYLGLRIDDLKERMKKANEVGFVGARMSPSDFAVMLQGTKDQIDGLESLQRDYKKTAAAAAQKSLDEANAAAKKKANDQEAKKLADEIAQGQRDNARDALVIGKQLPLVTNYLTTAYNGVIDAVGLANLGLMETPNIIDNLHSHLGKLQDDFSYIPKEMKKIAPEWEITVNDVISETSSMVSRLKSIFDMNTKNQLDALQQQTDAQLAANNAQMQADEEAAGVANSTAVQTAQLAVANAQATGNAITIKTAQDALTKAQIEQDYADKATAINKKMALDKYRLEKQAFEQNQAFSLAQVAIDTASGIMNIWSHDAWNPILSGILTGTVVALGIAQANAINNQVAPAPPALAEGGIVMPRIGGTIAQVAEAGQPEIIFPLDQLNRFISNSSSSNPTSNNSENINLTINLNKDVLYKGIFQATKNRSVLIDVGAVV
jgi:hypothetical protein